MGIDPTIFARPAPPRVSIAMVVCLAIGIIAGSIVHSPNAAGAAAIGALLTWRFGPLIGGIVVGALSAAVVMADPLLVHPMPGPMLAWVVGLMLVWMAVGMVARRDSTRAGAFASAMPERPIPPRARETPVRGGRPVTGEHARLRATGEMPRLRPTAEVQQLKPTPEPPRDPPSEDLDFPPLEISTGEMATLDLEREVIQRFLRDIRDVLGADEVALWQYFEDEDTVKPYAAAVQAPEELAMVTKPAVDSLVHTASVGGIGTNYDNELNYFYAIPAGAEGRFHGALGIYAEDRQSFARDRAKQMMKGFVDRLAELLHLLYDGRETRRYRGKVDDVAMSVELIQKQSEMAPLMAQICKSALQVCGASRAAFVVWNEEQQIGKVEHVEPPGGTATTVTAGSLAMMACKSDKTTVFRENFRSAGLPLFMAGEGNVKPGSVAAVGLGREGRQVGAIVVIGDRPAQITSVELNLLKSLARFASTAVLGVLALEEAKGEAKSDALTGLPNRAAFDERILQFMASGDRFGQKTSLILADVDKFKSINDTHGHAAGDEVLKAVAKTLLAGVRLVDLCARYGGEEVAIVLPQTDGKGAVEVAERLRKAIEDMKVVVEGKPIPVTASFGVASHPDSVFGVDNLFKAADDALYAAKHGGRNRVSFAEPKTKKA